MKLDEYRKLKLTDKRTPKAQPERDLVQVPFFNILRLNEKKFPVLKYVFAIPNGGLRHPATAKALFAEGVKAGILDVHLPVARRGFHSLFIEFKYGDNKLTKQQHDFMDFAAGENNCVRVEFTPDGGLNVIEWYLDIKLNR